MSQCEKRAGFNKRKLKSEYQKELNQRKKYYVKVINIILYVWQNNSYFSTIYMNCLRAKYFQQLA